MNPSGQKTPILIPSWTPPSVQWVVRFLERNGLDQVERDVLERMSAAPEMRAVWKVLRTTCRDGYPAIRLNKLSPWCPPGPPPAGIRLAKRAGLVAETETRDSLLNAAFGWWFNALFVVTVWYIKNPDRFRVVSIREAEEVRSALQRRAEAAEQIAGRKWREGKPVETARFLRSAIACRRARTPSRDVVMTAARDAECPELTGYIMNIVALLWRVFGEGVPDIRPVARIASVAIGMKVEPSLVRSALRSTRIWHPRGT